MYAYIFITDTGHANVIIDTASESDFWNTQAGKEAQEDHRIQYWGCLDLKRVIIDLEAIETLARSPLFLRAVSTMQVEGEERWKQAEEFLRSTDGQDALALVIAATIDFAQQRRRL